MQLGRVHRPAHIEVHAGHVDASGLDPFAGFVGLAHAWAAGEELSEVIEDEEMSGGDFVRNVRQVIDLVRQVGQVAAEAPTRAAADLAVALLRRGVVGADDPAATGSALDDLSRS